MTCDLSPGTILGGRYRVDRLLGRGGMGEVWAATHVVTRRAVALKLLNSRVRARPEMRRRLMREARAAAAVDHPDVVTVHDVFEIEDQAPVLVMDLLEGETLAERIARSDSLTLAETAEIILPVVSAVSAAHARGIVHRDLKPDNIFICRTTPGGEAVRVLDFGIAKLTAMAADAADTGNLTGTGSMMGTPCYMAPEQGFGERDIDHRADVWALGVILYECLSGGRPVEAENLGQFLKRLMREGITPLERVVPGLPEELTALVASMLAQDRTARLSDLSEAQRVLARCARPGTASSHDSVAPLFQAFPKRRGGRLGALGPWTAATLALLATSVLLVRSSHELAATESPETHGRQAPVSTPLGTAVAMRAAGPTSAALVTDVPLVPDLHPREEWFASSAALSDAGSSVAPPLVLSPPPRRTRARPTRTVAGGIIAEPPF